MVQWSDHIIYSGTILWILVSMTRSQHNCHQCNCIISEDERLPKRNINVQAQCREGRIDWPNPYGAVRLELRPRLSRFPGEFRSCLIVNALYTTVKISRELHGSLQHLRTISGKSREFCIESLTPVFLYFEPDYALSVLTKALTRVTVDYDIERFNRKLFFDPLEDCRPCDKRELLNSYCSSDYVVEGNIVHTRHQDQETNIDVHIQHLIQHSQSRMLEMRHYGTDVQTHGTIVAPRKCGITRGTGRVYMFTGRVKLGRMRFGCVVPMDRWQIVKREAEETGDLECSRD